ncbi:hypothetical protein PHSY_002997 [Pseudozyma hubeiensis SY62]|uniref:Uncharacterized protein n=1 Tax=Pseudozyma hubeiensis (strain SY62) TaxID=1305764 RepID=R9P293_PSEHS|nr:hypothetical protein PHSY_002997 [Pseudozyma hubeiensis SY62]GAC95421.1 hypothetical protein PHSY_002997 [Pseudozyma hubeiensis SY62]
MPPEPIAFDSSDEDEKRYPLYTVKRLLSRPIASDSEIDELESDADDDPNPAPPVRRKPPSPKKSSSASQDPTARKKRREQKRRKKEEHEERKRRKAEKKQALAARAERQNGHRDGSARSRATQSPQDPSSSTVPSTSKSRANGVQASKAPATIDVASDSDEPLPSLVVRPSQTQPSLEPTQESRTQAQAQAMSEDEVELIASQSVAPPTADSQPARASSLPTAIDLDDQEQPSQRSASAVPHAAGASGQETNPIQLDGSDSLLQHGSNDQRDGADDDISEVSSIWYSESDGHATDSELYTSSEGSLHDTDEERGLGSWTQKDRDTWQGSTYELDEAYGGTYDVRAVLRHRHNPRRGFAEYRTVFAGYPIHSSMWLQESLFDDERTLREYWARQGGRPDDFPEDRTSYTEHSSDTETAVKRRPRQRAHEALRNKRLDIRRDKIQLRQYLKSLGEERNRAQKEAEDRYAAYRRKKNLGLELRRVHDKGSTRGNKKRLEKQQQKRWRRDAGGNGADAAGSSRFSATHANRALADISMRARPSATSGMNSARMRASQLNDSIPENDDSQMTFRRPGGSSFAGNFPGLSKSMAPMRERPGFSASATRPTMAPLGSASALPSSTNSASHTQPTAPRPAPGSYKGAHRREPKVQVQPDFNRFLNRLHGSTSSTSQRANNQGAAQPLQAPTDSNGQPITSGRRPSEARRSNLLVLKPVEDFQGASRPFATALSKDAHSSASSETGDQDTFGVPEMSTVRGQYNPHQQAPSSDGEAAQRAKQGPASALASSSKSASIQRAGSSQQGAQRVRVEDPRRRPALAASETQGVSQAGWSPTADDVPWSPHERNSSALDTGSTGADSPVPAIPPSPADDSSTTRSYDGQQAKAPQHKIWNGWFEFVVGHNRIEAEGDLLAAEPLSPDRKQTLGLTNPGGTAYFHTFLPFAWIRDMLAGHSAAINEVMLLKANGVGARSSLDQLSEQLKDLDVALLAYAGQEAFTGDDSGRKDYFVAFSSKYDIDYVSGLPPSLRSVRGHPHTLCTVPLQLEHHPAPSLPITFEKPPALEGSIDNVFEASIGKKAIEDLNISRTDIRKVRRAAQRYRISKELYEGIRSKYNVIFLGQNPPAYEKSVLYFMVRIFEGGARLGLDAEKDAKLWKDPKRGTNVFVRRAALEGMFFFDASDKALWLAPYLRRLKRQPRCRFWTYGFAPDDPDERVREIFPGCDGLVTISASAVLGDLVRSSVVETDNQEREEGQLTQNDKTPPDSILCNIAYHLADNWKVRLHPWIRTCFKLIADHLEPVCRALHLIQEDQGFPMELMLDLDSKLEALYTSALVEEWSADEISGLPFDEPSEVPDEPQQLIERIDNEVLASLRKSQSRTVSDTRFHVLVSQGAKMSEEELAGIELTSLAQVAENHCRELANLPGN